MKKCVFIFLLVLTSVPLFAGIPALEREVNLTLIGEKFSNVLIKIQDQTGIVFSYQPSVISNIEPVTLQIKRKTVREALALLLPPTVTYKAKNDYIILKEKPLEQNPKKTEISGYVIDKKTEQKVANVTVYDKESLQSVTTDAYGYYSISVPSKNDKITVNKENYQDTSITLADAKANKLNNISIAPVTEEQRKQDSLLWKEKWKEIGVYTSDVYKKIKGFVHTINIKDTITRNFQVSVLPFVGTNHKLSGNVVNKLSFNVLGGFAKGVNGFEAGTLFNIDAENAKGAQLAGIFNIVGDSALGTQLAGCFNITGRGVSGFQAAGLMNINEGNQLGVQMASLLNINAKNAKGLSMAGLMNISTSVNGVQVAALGNVSDTLEGVAIAGLFNVNDVGEKSVQIASLFNEQSKGTTQLQIAGLFNSTHYLKGIQLAPLNFADSASGIPFGFFSFVKTGVHQIELQADELFTANLALRTGVPAFYNVFSAGFQPGSDKQLWHFGYGAGTSFRIKNKWRSDVTLSMHHLSAGSFYNGTSELYKLYWGLEYKVAKKFSCAFGPTFNLYFSDALLPDYQTYASIAPYSLFDVTNAYDFNLKGWVGARLALRFL